MHAVQPAGVLGGAQAPVVPPLLELDEPELLPEELELEPELDPLPELDPEDPELEPDALPELEPEALPELDPEPPLLLELDDEDDEEPLDDELLPEDEPEPEELCEPPSAPASSPSPVAGL